MSHVKWLYGALGTLLVTGIGGSLLTPFGVNEGVGTFSAGITIGVLIAIYVLRTAELRNIDTTSTSHLNFHGSPTDVEPGSEELVSDQKEESVVDQESTENLKQTNSDRTGNLLMFDSPVSTDPHPQPLATDRTEQVQADQCTCACGCQLRSKGGVIDLCGNCKRWFQQQSVRCTCDSMTSENCSCGAIKHQPVRRNPGFATAA